MVLAARAGRDVPAVPYPKDRPFVGSLLETSTNLTVALTAPSRVQLDGRMDETSAIHEPMLAVGWIGNRPVDHEIAWQDGTPIPAHWREVVVDRRLACGIAVRVERCGFAIYDFAGWRPGVANPPGLPAIRTFGQSSEAAKPALIARLRVINSHLTLLHAAAMARADESPRVTRVHERDLYRFDYPDEGGDGYWYQPLGGTVRDVVNPTDRHRYGVMPLDTFELALDWLDDVVAARAIIVFDLLNHAQAALVTHDYGLAVTAGWTVCELQARALANSSGLNVAPDAHANTVCGALETAGVLPAGLAPRLAALRQRRNKWLHNGQEPNEVTALDAVELATAMLRPIVPNLTTRAMRGLLYL